MEVMNMYPVFYNRDDMFMFYNEAKIRANRCCEVAAEVKSIRAWLWFKFAVIVLWVMKAVGHLAGKLHGTSGYNHAAWKFREVCEQFDTILEDEEES